MSERQVHKVIKILLEVVGSNPSIVVHNMLAYIIFIIGILGIVFNRKNVIIMLMSIELMLLASSINLVLLSYNSENALGHVAAIYVLTVAAAEACIGLAIIIGLYRVTGSAEIRQDFMTRL